MIYRQQLDTPLKTGYELPHYLNCFCLWAATKKLLTDLISGTNSYLIKVTLYLISAVPQARGYISPTDWPICLPSNFFRKNCPKEEEERAKVVRGTQSDKGVLQHAETICSPPPSFTLSVLHAFDLASHLSRYVLNSKMFTQVEFVYMSVNAWRDWWVNYS